MNWLLCKIGLHRWSFREIWEPSIHAPIVTRFVFIAQCAGCGRRETTEDRFDPITGEPIAARAAQEAAA